MRIRTELILLFGFRQQLLNERIRAQQQHGLGVNAYFVEDHCQLVDENNIEVALGVLDDRSGPIRLNSSLSFLSGISANPHAASLPVGSITA